MTADVVSDTVNADGADTAAGITGGAGTDTLNFSSAATYTNNDFETVNGSSGNDNINATLSIVSTVSVTPVNDEPVANDDTGSMSEDAAAA